MWQSVVGGRKEEREGAGGRGGGEASTQANRHAGNQPTEAFVED